MDDNKLLILFHNAHRQASTNPNALDVIEAIQREWRSRLEKAMNCNYKATMPEKGMLSAFGYCVGSSGITDTSKRRELLILIFKSDLPVVGSPAYTLEWGERLSQDRYMKLRKTLIGLISNNHYKNMEQAIEHWKGDLDFVDAEIKSMVSCD